jgi:hypothetical protein
VDLRAVHSAEAGILAAEAGILAAEEDILVAAAVVTPAEVVEVTLAVDTVAGVTESEIRTAFLNRKSHSSIS